MNWVDLLLNLAGLLLCLHWRLASLPDLPIAGVSLVSTLKRAASNSARRWPTPLALALLLSGRALFYWLLGPGLEWVPTLSLGPLALHVRSQSLASMQLYSAASFTLALGTAVLWLLLLAIVNRSLPLSDPGQRIVRHLLGPLARLPAAAQALVPVLVAGLTWAALAHLLARSGFLPSTTSAELLRQSTVLALWSWLAGRDFLLVLLAVCFLNSHVYFGSLPIWHYLALTGRHLLRPLRILPLVWGRIDLAPLLAMALVFFATRYAALGLAWLFYHPLR